MESGEILDSQINSSSSHGSDFEAWQARLGNDKCWASLPDEDWYWIDVDFLTVVVLSGIKIQGGGIEIDSYVEEIIIKHRLVKPGPYTTVYYDGDKQV